MRHLEKAIVGRLETAYFNNSCVNKCGWRRWIMLDGRSSETLGKKGSAGKSKSAYSNNRSVTKCGWRM